MPLIAFPSADSPEFPAVELELPDSWERIWPPDALLAGVHRIEGHFSPNITVSVSRYGPEYSMELAVGGLKEAFTRLSDGEWSEDGLIVLAGHDCYVAEFAYVDPVAGTLFQSHRLVVLHCGPVSFLIHALGSCGTENTATAVEEIRASLASLRITARTAQ